MKLSICWVVLFVCSEAVEVFRNNDISAPPFSLNLSPLINSYCLLYLYFYLFYHSHYYYVLISIWMFKHRFPYSGGPLRIAHGYLDWILHA